MCLLVDNAFDFITSLIILFSYEHVESYNANLSALLKHMTICNAVML